MPVVCEGKKEDFSILLAVLQYIPSPPSGPTNYAKFFRKSCLDTPVSFFFCRWVWQGISRKILVLISHLTLPLPRSYPKEICVEHTLLTNKGVTLGNVIVKSWVLPINIRWEPKRKKNHPCQDSKKKTQGILIAQCVKIKLILFRKYL